VIIFKPLPHNDPKKRKPDITLAREKIRWAPKVPLGKGLLKSITYFDDLLSNGKNEPFQVPGFNENNVTNDLRLET